MKLDDWITPDSYHLQDLLEHGRCLRCGHLAKLNSKPIMRKGLQLLSCSRTCRKIIENAIDDLN